MPFIRLHQRLKKLGLKTKLHRQTDRKTWHLTNCLIVIHPCAKYGMSIEKIKEFVDTNQCYKTYNFYLEVKVQGNIQVIKVCKASAFGLVLHPCAKWYVYINLQKQMDGRRQSTWVVIQPCTKYGQSLAKNYEVTVWTQIHVKQLIILLTLRSSVTFI